MLSSGFGIMLVLIVLVVLLVIAGVVIGVLIARNRKRDEGFGAQFGQPTQSDPGSGGWIGIAGQSHAHAAPVQSPALAQAAAPTQASTPIQLPTSQQPSVQPHQAFTNDTLQVSPFGRATEQDYARLAAEPFLAPPATPLGQTVAPEPFSWTAAISGSDETEDSAQHPTPEFVWEITDSAAFEPATFESSPLEPASFEPAPLGSTSAAPVAPRVPGLLDAATQPVQAPQRTEVTEDDFDLTSLVVRSAVTDWNLVLPDGSTVPLETETILGRKPPQTPGVYAVAVPDPTRTVSKVHAKLQFDGSVWAVEDLHSTNGVGLLHEDTEQLLEPGSPAIATPRIMLGTLVVRLQHVPQPDQTQSNQAQSNQLQPNPAHYSSGQM